MLSRISWLLATMLMCYASFFYYPKWEHKTTEATISWDVSGYYWYLPSVFIYKDLKHQSFKDSVLSKYEPTYSDFQQGLLLPNGNYVMKYSSGMAFMYLPFFTIAHVLAKPLGYPADGFSPPYQFAVQMGGLLVSIIGLWYFRKLFLTFYSDTVVAICLLLLVLGSNYLNYSAIDNGMSHCWLFTVYTFLLLNTLSFYQSFRTKYAIRIGLLIGLATLTRPTDIISCLIPLLWGIEYISVTAIKSRLALIWGKRQQLFIAATCAALIIFVQLIYWKWVSGHWISYSYGNDQKLYFRSPNFMKYTFSFQSGWLTYSPMLFFAFIGLIPFWKNGKNKVAIIVFFLLSYYLVCCWNIWWYGGRAMIQSYPVLFFPIASLVNFCLSRKLAMWSLAPFAVIFIYFNIWFLVQSHGAGFFDAGHASKRYFWRVAGRWSVPENTALLMDNTELYERSPVNLSAIYQHSFRHDSGAAIVADTATGEKFLVLNGKQQGSPIYSFPYKKGSAQWIRVIATYQCNKMEHTWDKLTQLVVRVTRRTATGGSEIVKENVIRPAHLLQDSVAKRIALDMKLPSQPYDSVNIVFWNAESDREIKISDLAVWQFEE